MRYVGTIKKFIYPNYGRPDGFPDHTAHSGQPVKVLRRLTLKECESPMYVIQATDGWTGHAHKDELHRR